MAPQLTDDERQRIADLCREGKTCNEIAQIVGRSSNTVSRVARDIGHEFAQVNALRAREARSAYSAEVRAEIATKAAQRALKILDGFENKQPVVVGFGVQDLDLDARAQKDRASAVQILARTVLDIAKLDEKREQGEARGLLERLVDAMDREP